MTGGALWGEKEENRFFARVIGRLELAKISRLTHRGYYYNIPATKPLYCFAIVVPASSLRIKYYRMIQQRRCSKQIISLQCARSPCIIRPSTGGKKSRASQPSANFCSCCASSRRAALRYLCDLLGSYSLSGSSSFFFTAPRFAVRWCGLFLLFLFFFLILISAVIARRDPKATLTVLHAAVLAGKIDPLALGAALAALGKVAGASRKLGAYGGILCHPVGEGIFAILNDTAGLLALVNG